MMSIVDRVWHTSEVDGRNIKKESIKIVDKTREKWDREFQEKNADKLIKQTLEVDAKWKQDNNYDETGRFMLYTPSSKLV